MTELQFDRVFNRALAIQECSLERKDALEAARVLKGFEGGTKKIATTTQAAYILNVVCMDMSGSYTPESVAKVKELYLENVTIKGEKKEKSKKKKK